MKYKSRINTSTELDKLVLKRDKFKCSKCPKTKGLEVHHIVPVNKDIPEEEIAKLDVQENLITLCHACHKKEHNMSGCFGQGDEKDNRRFLGKKFKKGNRYRFEKGVYYNRHIGEWVGR